MTERHVLSLEELESFDPQAPQGTRRRFCCPLCGQGKPRDGAHRSLSVEIASGLWVCFRCEAKGKLREKWEERPLDRRVQTRRVMRAAFGLELPVIIKDVAQPRPTPSLAPLRRDVDQVALESISSESKDSWRHSLPGLFPLNGSPGQTYLEGRGLPLSLCLEAKVKWALSWFGRPAVVFPIYDDAGTLVAAQGRYTDGHENPKARTLGSKKQGVFLSPNFWRQVQQGAPVTIVEAPIDALSIALCGFPALALCGKSGHPEWLAVRCAFKTVFVAFDADEAGEQGYVQLVPTFEALGSRVRRLVPQGVKDWNEALQAGCDELTDWLAPQIL